MADWTQITCDACGGSGLTQKITSVLGGDGPDECRWCGATGRVWRSPKGRLASWPGGPFIGRDEPAGLSALKEQETGE